MTPTELETAIRERYNALNDTFFSQSEIFNYIYHAQCILAVTCNAIQNKATATTTSGTREYAFPTNAMAIKRVEYNGRKLTPISFKEDDALTLSDSTTQDLGTPSFYSQWDKTIYLRPTPDSSSATLTYYVYSMPQAVTTVSTLDVPAEFHMSLSYFALYMMSLKDQNESMALAYVKMWDAEVARCKQWQRKMYSSDSFRGIQDLEMLPNTIVGNM